jgi:UDP-N-acetyl-D-mannosaminuronic acid transferase (WecB/TagA/CpsF family)
MRAAGLEWAFRLAREPKRLARRYLLEGPIAAWRVLACSTTAIEGVARPNPTATR